MERRVTLGDVLPCIQLNVPAVYSTAPRAVEGVVEVKVEVIIASETLLNLVSGSLLLFMDENV